jgi:hypothetical protein
MKLTRTSGALGLAALAALSAPLAMAQDNTGWYGGADVGRSAASAAACKGRAWA